MISWYSAAEPRHFTLQGKVSSCQREPGTNFATGNSGGLAATHVLLETRGRLAQALLFLPN